MCAATKHTVPLIKICGLQDVGMTRLTAEAGADFIGFVHYPPSPRHVSIRTASLLSRVLANYKTRSVLLLVDPTDDLLAHIKRVGNFNYIQLHGDETPARVATIKAMLSTSIIKAFRVSCVSDIQSARAYEGVAEWLLFDAKSPKGEKGGTGTIFDWTLLEKQKFDIPWMLSGGLNLNNATQAIISVNPMGVDISSGVETIRGVKDMGKILSFIGAVQGG